MRLPRRPTGKTRSRIRLLLWVSLGFLVVLLLAAGGGWYWYYHRPMPESVQQTLFSGVTYIRDVRHFPRPMVIHVIIVDLDAPGVSFVVTPGDPKRSQPLRAQTTSEFLAKQGTQVAINGDFFFPWHSNSPWDYYPHVGDPCDVEGFAASRGVVYSDSPRKRHYKTLFLSEHNQASFGIPEGKIYNAISGLDYFLLLGQYHSVYRGDDKDLMPRTAVALDAGRQHLILVLVDGRQPNYSEGATLKEMADIVQLYGGYTALDLDGGGSETLVVEDEAHQPKVLNCPIDNHIPGRERPVANHLGIFARRF